MVQVWDQTRVQQYIDDGIEESQKLDYKAAGALDKSGGKRKEITKDVSAMANTDGGVIIYGLKEDSNNRHLPGQIDPVNRLDFSKESLQQVIGNIRPKIDGLLIYPVPIGNSNTDVVYVVEIPKSHTVHQASDKRYYKRFNFECVAMDDYEIREAMNRGQHPRIVLYFKLVRIRSFKTEEGLTKEVGNPIYNLKVYATNSGSVRATDKDIKIQLPSEDERTRLRTMDYDATDDGKPIFPGRCKYIRNYTLGNDFEALPLENLFLTWIVSADDAPKSEGEVAFSNIKVIDRPVTMVYAPMDVF